MNAARAIFKPRFLAERLAAQTPDLKLIAQRIAAQTMSGHHAARKAGSGESFWQYREYIAGDAPNAIDWRQSAKTDRIFIREKEQHKAQTHIFWTQRDASMDFVSSKKLLSKHQAASVLALALALLYSREGELIGFAGEGTPGHSERSLQSFEHILFAHADAALPAPSIKIKQSCGLTLIGDFLSPIEEIEAALSPLAQRTRNGVLIQVLDPAEIDLPYAGRVIFENGEQRVLMNNVRDIADEYHERITAHNFALSTLCKKLGWQYEQHVTNTDPAAIMLNLWKRSLSVEAV